MGKRLVLVGGGHAHMMALAGIHGFVAQGHEVTVIGPSDHHYYSGMGPGMLGGFYTPGDIRFATRQVVEKQGGRFIRGKAVSVDPDKRIVYLESGEGVPYDVVSFNTGSQVPTPEMEGGQENIYSVKPIERLQEARDRIESLLSERPLCIGVVGGGPSSIEIAGNVWRLCRQPGRHAAEVIVFAGSSLMASFSEGIQSRARRSLAKRGIAILEGARVTRVTDGGVVLDSGESHALDFVFLGLGVVPGTIFADSGLPTGPDGGLLVNRYLQCTDYPEVFGGGDCIHFQDRPLNRVGVYAVRQNPVLVHNLTAELGGGVLHPFDPGGDYLLVFNMGDGTGILSKQRVTFGGRLAFMIKDYIDRRFMRKFQALE